MAVVTMMLASATRLSSCVVCLPRCWVQIWKVREEALKISETLKRRLSEPRTLVFVRYRDHVLYHRAQLESLKPQVRECVGWLVYDSAEYIIISWDRDAGPPRLRGGDPKASGLVVLRSDILEMKRIASVK